MNSKTVVSTVPDDVTTTSFPICNISINKSPETVWQQVEKSAASAKNRTEILMTASFSGGKVERSKVDVLSETKRTTNA